MGVTLLSCVYMLEDMFMNGFEKEELEEALRAITSTLRKSEKAQLKLKAGYWQHTMTEQGIKSYKIAIDLIKNELETTVAEEELKGKYTKKELTEALNAIISAIGRVERVQPKFETGTSQHTLAVRRIQAYNVATQLIKRELKRFI